MEIKLISNLNSYNSDLQGTADAEGYQIDIVEGFEFLSILIKISGYRFLEEADCDQSHNNLDQQWQGSKVEPQGVAFDGTNEFLIEAYLFQIVCCQWRQGDQEQANAMKPAFASLFLFFEDVFEEEPQIEAEGEIVDEICCIGDNEHDG